MLYYGSNFEIVDCHSTAFGFTALYYNCVSVPFVLQPLTPGLTCLSYPEYSSTVSSVLEMSVATSAPLL